MPTIQNTGRADPAQLDEIKRNIDAAFSEYRAGNIQGGHALAILWTMAAVHAPKVIPNDDPAQLALIMRPGLDGLMPQTRAATDVLAERQRQINVEGWTSESDDTHHFRGELALAAACYALCDDARDEASSMWPWDADWWKPAGERRNLVKAGALILAEIERLDRAAMKGQP